MAKVGQYCKAYTLSQLRAYPEWSESAPLHAANGNGERAAEDVSGRSDSSGETIVFLQENFVVTAGMYQDEDVIFQAVTPRWLKYCEEVLRFSIPEDLIESDSGGKT